MAKHTFTSTHTFKYRFQCEHCGQTTEWKNAYFREQTEYQAAPFEGKEMRLVAKREFNEEFAKKVPLLQQEVEEGNYDNVFSGLDGRCPNCKKQQSWEKVKNTGCMFGISVFMGFFTLISWKMFNAATSLGEGKAQLIWLIAGVFGVISFLLCLFLGISGERKKSAIKRDIKNITIHNKPEFSWADKEPQKI